MGHLAGASATQAFSNFSGDGWSVGVVFTYQASTGQYTNATYGALSALAFDTGSNLGDTATISLFATSSAANANAYAANALILAENPALFTNEGSVVVVTGSAAATPPSTATPDGIAAAALSYVGAAWNDNGCWVLASDISAKAGATLPLTSTASGMAGIANGEWIVAYNGPVSASSSWVNNLLTGEIVCFVTTSGGGHITTVASGSGQNARLIDNITLVGSNGSILDSANDGSSSDVLVQPAHAASQEFTGVNAAAVVVYELDTPIVTDTVSGLSLSEGVTVSLSADFSASNPKAGQSITQYQVYETSAADPLMLSGVADKTALTAATASTLTSLSTLGLTTAATAGTDTIELRAFNGSYWGDWTALAVSIAAPATLSAAAAVATTGASQIAVTDTAANIGAAADKLQVLAGAGRLASVTITGSGLVPVTVAQLTSDKTLLSLLPSTAALQVSGATVAQAAALQANAQVASFALTDTGANVSAALSGLLALTTGGKLSAITLSNPTTPLTFTTTQLTSDAAVLALIGGSYSLALTGATVATASALAAQSHTATVGITDTAADVGAGLGGLQTLAAASKLGAITLTNGGTPSFSLTAAQLTADKTALGKIASSFSLAITGSTAAAAASVSATADVASVAISDSAANVLANLTSLETLASGSKLAAISLTDASKPTLSLTATQFTSDTAALAKITTPVVIDVTGASVAQAAAMQASALVTNFTITTTAANATGQTTLGKDSKLTALTISGTTGADTLNLTGIGSSVIVNLSGDSATASGGLGGAGLNFLTPPDAITLGSGAATITAGLSGSSGIETIANFQFGLDQLLLNLGTLSTMTAINTSYNGQHAIALTGGSLTQGVVLLGQPSTITAASLLASHIHTSNGVATIS